jgi:uncharacterized protein (UPF0332 family)
MSLDDLLRQRRLQEHRASAEEIADLVRKAHVYLANANVQAISVEGRFMQAYNAALALATAVLAASGYRPRGAAYHTTLFEASPMVMGEGIRTLSENFDVCRLKRHQALYGRLGKISQREVEELAKSVELFAGMGVSRLELVRLGTIERQVNTVLGRSKTLWSRPRHRDTDKATQRSKSFA